MKFIRDIIAEKTNASGTTRLLTSEEKVESSNGWEVTDDVTLFEDLSPEAPLIPDAMDEPEMAESGDVWGDDIDPLPDTQIFSRPSDANQTEAVAATEEIDEASEPDDTPLFGDVWAVDETGLFEEDSYSEPATVTDTKSGALLRAMYPSDPLDADVQPEMTASDVDMPGFDTPELDINEQDTPDLDMLEPDMAELEMPSREPAPQSSPTQSAQPVQSSPFQRIMQRHQATSAPQATNQATDMAPEAAAIPAVTPAAAIPAPMAPPVPTQVSAPISPPTPNPEPTPELAPELASDPMMTARPVPPMPVQMPVQMPAPASGRANRKAGRVKTRLLGFSSDQDHDADPFASKSTPEVAAQTMYPVGWMVVISGPGRGTAFTLFNGVSQIGRGEGQAVRLDFGDNSISRENHAAIAYDGEQQKFYLGHGGKANLVRLNGSPVLSTEAMESGALIRIGETTLRFVALCGDGFDWDKSQDCDGDHARFG